MARDLLPQWDGVVDEDMGQGRQSRCVRPDARGPPQDGLAGSGWSKRRRPSSAATGGGNRLTPLLLEMMYRESTTVGSRASAGGEAAAVVAPMETHGMASL